MVQLISKPKMPGGNLPPTSTISFVDSSFLLVETVSGRQEKFAYCQQVFSIH